MPAKGNADWGRGFVSRGLASLWGNAARAFYSLVSAHELSCQELRGLAGNDSLLDFRERRAHGVAVAGHRSRVGPRTSLVSGPGRRRQPAMLRRRGVHPNCHIREGRFSSPDSRDENEMFNSRPHRYHDEQVLAEHQVASGVITETTTPRPRTCFGPKFGPKMGLVGGVRSVSL